MTVKQYKTYAVIISLFVFLFSSTAYSTSPQQLTFLNWADYIDLELVKKFEKQYNAKVHIVTFDSDDNRSHLLVSTNGKNFDVATVDGDSIQGYVRKGWLTNLSEEEIPNLKNILPKWANAYKGAAGYAVPYFWGTVGIAYRSDLVSTAITSWMDILQPAEELHGKIFMLPQSRELIDLALKASGHSVNTTNSPNAYKEVRQILLEQKQYVKKYDIPAVNEKSALISGKVLAAVTYSGDALTLQELNENIEYVIPSEGSILWSDYLVVMEKSGQKKLAMDFINFLNEAQNAAEHAEYMHYATPNAAAKKLLPQEFLADPIIYPSNEIMEKCEIETDLPARVHKTRNTLFMEVTRDNL